MSFANYELIRTWSEDGFRLELYDTHKTDSMGKSRLAYRFYDDNYTDGINGVRECVADRHEIFRGNDFCCSPLHAIDSDQSIGGLLGFLSLRPGDTDKEYFDDYTERQMEWCVARAEELSIHAVEFEEGIECYASIYGDGALYDFNYTYNGGIDSISHDTEGDYAILVLRVSPSIAKRAYAYCRENNTGAEPYSDGYEAMECFEDPISEELHFCSVEWSTEECKRLGGCFLCGTNHDN